MLFRFLHTSSAKYTTISLPRNRRSYGEFFHRLLYLRRIDKRALPCEAIWSSIFLLDAEENGKNAVSKIFYLQEVFILIAGAEVVIVLFAHEIA